MQQPAATATTHTVVDDTVLDRALPALVIHTALRRETRLAGPLVRAVAEGDERRATVVAAHLGVILRLLHHHHENEDLLVWPPLEARALGDEPALVATMKDQHAELERHLAQVEAILPRWSAGAGAGERDALADALDGLHVTLADHLALEEARALPMAERLLTDEEWVAIGEHGEKGAEGPEKLLVFGILAYEGDPVVLDQMLSAAPYPVRKLLPRLALRRYRRHARRVYGTPAP